MSVCSQFLKQWLGFVFRMLVTLPHQCLALQTMDVNYHWIPALSQGTGKTGPSRMVELNPLLSSSHFQVRRFPVF